MLLEPQRQQYDFPVVPLFSRLMEIELAQPRVDNPFRAIVIQSYDLLM